MANFEAKVNKIGSKYYVTNVFMSEIRYIMPNDKFIQLTDDVALRIKNDVTNGKIVSIDSKTYKSRKQLNYEDFEIREAKNQLDERKRAAKARANAGVTAYTAMLSALDLYDFFCIVSKMMALGFNVMDQKNKEEVYLEVINTGDDGLIEDLEKFLEAKEKFDRVSQAYKGLREFFREIDACKKVSDITKIEKEHSGWLIQ